MTQQLYQTALKYAGELHAAQLVPGTSANYLLHLSNVAMEVMMAYQYQPDFDLNLAMQVAILHDSIEDTEATEADIRNRFGDQIAECVLALTKDESIPEKTGRMADSLRRILLTHREASIVKLADRITNLQPAPAHWPTEKRTYYREQAQVIARELAGKHEYLEKRLAEQIEGYSVEGEGWVLDSW